VFQYFLAAHIIDENAYGIVAISELYSERVKERFDESKFEIDVCSQRSFERIDVVLTTKCLRISRRY
jgi:hypothetical protein